MCTVPHNWLRFQVVSLQCGEGTKERNPLPVQSSSPIDKIFKSLFPIQRPSAAAAIFAERKNCTFFVFFCQNGTKTVSSFSSSSFSSAASSSYSASDPFMPQQPQFPPLQVYIYHSSTSSAAASLRHHRNNNNR